MQAQCGPKEEVRDPQRRPQHRMPQPKLTADMGAASAKEASQITKKLSRTDSVQMPPQNAETAKGVATAVPRRRAGSDDSKKGHRVIMAIVAQLSMHCNGMETELVPLCHGQAKWQAHRCSSTVQPWCRDELLQGSKVGTGPGADTPKRGLRRAR